MAMTMRDRWTDERLDDLKDSVDAGFRRVDEQFDKVDQRFEKVDERFEKVDQRFDRLEEKLDRRFDLIDQRFDTVMLSLFHGAIAFSAAMVAGFVALAVAAL